MLKSHANRILPDIPSKPRFPVALLWLGALALASPISTEAQRPAGSARKEAAWAPISQSIMLRIVRAEDERRWDKDLNGLMSDERLAVRKRAALAAGRIGNETAVQDLISLIKTDPETAVRSMAAFALGEIESTKAVDALMAELAKQNPPALRARVVEALGKIAAALPATEEERKRSLGKTILQVLDSEAQTPAGGSGPDTELILFGLTAALRARPEGAGKVVAQFLSYSDPHLRADAANTLARLRANDGNAQLRKLLNNDPAPIVRANAARVLGATEDKTAFDGLLDRALRDTDLRVRISSIRALASLKNSTASEPLLRRGLALSQQDLVRRPAAVNEVLEIATTLGRLLQGTGNEQSLAWLGQLPDIAAPEMLIASVRISPATFLKKLGKTAEAKRKAEQTVRLDWRIASGLAQGLGEFAAVPDSTIGRDVIAAQAQDILRTMLDYRNFASKIDSSDNVDADADAHSEYAIPDILRALAAFKPNDLAEVLRKHLKEPDVIIRATAAELLGELPPDETNMRALTEALPVALTDTGLNDAALAILDALGKQKTASANDLIRSVLGASDPSVRSRAVSLLKTNGAGDFSAQADKLPTRNTTADYERAISRIGKSVRATVSTNKGSITIELLPDDAPLNVDNFVQLAKRGYFRGITFHRVVPNFVIQGGDPRGDGNGGPGYQIRCEINEVSYERGAVGMALSGKDTGGSQWFVTHSRQPHLDGGYTVFGRVLAGIDVVDRIVRGDVIRSIVVNEGPRGAARVPGVRP